jgi:predicted RNA methylase
VSTLILLALLLGCPRRYREDLNYDFNVQQVWEVEELNWRDVVQFESVFWELDDTQSLRKMIANDGIAKQRDCLEIGTGTGLLSLMCLHFEAKSVIATDINPAAVANARYNAAMMNLETNFEVRQVNRSSPEAFAVINSNEQFDLIISNPPWEDGSVHKPADHAFYDPHFRLMDSLLDGLPTHLKIDGRCLLAYGHRPAIERLLTACRERGLATKILDDRQLDELPADFLPGMVVEVRCPNSVAP